MPRNLVRAREGTPLTELVRSLSRSAQALGRAFRLPGFYALLLLSAALWAVAYQYKTTYTIDIGGLQDNAFVSGFNDKETNGQLTYRWTTGTSEITLPGLGNEPVVVSLVSVGSRPPGTEPPPQITVTVRSTLFPLQTQPLGQPYASTLFVGRGDPLDGDLRIALRSPTFSTPTDPRKLGLALDRVTVAPAGTGLRPIVIPPLGTVTGLLSGLILCYAGAAVATRRRIVALLFASLLSLIATVLVLVARLELGLLAPQLLTLCAWGLLFAFLGRVLLDDLVAGWSAARGFAIAAGSAAFALAFVFRFGGLTYPQFLTSDIGLHIHYVQRVMTGDWVFSGLLPDGTPVPYPPAYYVLLAPLAFVFGSSDATVGLLLKWSSSLLDAATCLALAWSGWRLWPGRAGGLAALMYAMSIAPFVLFSAGNYSNLFAQSMLNLTLLGGLVLLSHSADRQQRAVSYPVLTIACLSLAAGFALTVLGHYGMMLATLAIMGIFFVWVLVDKARGRRPGESWILLGLFTGAAAASFLAYYGHFVVEMWNQWSSVLRRLLGERVPTRPGAQPGQSSPTEALPTRLARKINDQLGISPTLTALFGTISISPNRRMAPGVAALLTSWLLASVVFLFLDQTLGDAIRWYYLAAAPVALVGGRFLAWVAARGRAGRALVTLVLAVMLAQWASSWIGDAIFTKYH